jgi:hypothetical protein
LLTQPEVWGKANQAQDKDFALLWLNLAYLTEKPNGQFLGLIVMSH